MLEQGVPREQFIFDQVAYAARRMPGCMQYPDPQPGNRQFVAFPDPVGRFRRGDVPAQEAPACIQIRVREHGLVQRMDEQPGPFLHQRRDPADMVKMPVGQQDRRDPPVPGLLPDPSRLIPGIDHDAFLFILLIQDIAAGLYDPHRQFVHSHKASLRSHDTGYPV